MKPKSLSASAAHVFELCPARYGAESFARTPNSNNSAADLGTAVHDALEQWCISGQMKDPDATLKELLALFDSSYDRLFGEDASRKDEGRDLCEKWYTRNQPITHEIISAEVKENFPIKVKFEGEFFTVPFNYIWDRCDRLPDGEIDIVDYKGLAVDTPIPTPTGWATMGKLDVGDEVIGGNGKSCRVKHKSETKFRKCYELEFDDGTTIVCDDEHRWEVQVADKGSRWQPPVVMTANQIAERGLLNEAGKQRGIRIGTVAVDLPEADLPIDPYVFGAWLGDGNKRNGAISKPLPELFEEVERRGYEVGPWVGGDTSGYRTVYGLVTQLKLLGVIKNKHIPDEYLRASRSQRLDLLRGIMDTDGHFNPTRKRVVLNTTSQAYAEEVYELVVSLGWTANIFATTATGFGREWDAWQLWFTPTGENVFSARNQDVEQPTSTRPFRRLIKAITEVPTVPTQCIEVDSPDHCFLAGRQMVKTHNTIAMYLNAEQMREKLQVRCYGLAGQVKFPDAKRIWVTYDMLRHGDPLGVSFTKEENVETYRYLQGLLLRILEADANLLEEKVNDECRWCIRKQVCSALRKHANVGGVHAITDMKVAAERRMKMDQVSKALKVAIEELDGMLMKHMEQEDALELEMGPTKVIVTAQGRRDVDAEQVKRIVPDDVWDTYAASKLTMGNLDKLMKDERLSDEDRQSVKRLITKTYGAPRIMTKPTTEDEDE